MASSSRKFRFYIYLAFIATKKDLKKILRVLKRVLNKIKYKKKKKKNV